MENLNADDGGIIVAGNHISWFDPLVISHALWENDRPPRFLAKESVFRVPIVGAIIRSAGQIPVYRETREALAAVRDPDAVTAIEAGECVVVYPEGTITKDPDLGRWLARRVRHVSPWQPVAPIIPVAQWGACDVIGPPQEGVPPLASQDHARVGGEPVDLSDLAGRPLDHATLDIAHGSNRPGHNQSFSRASATRRPRSNGIPRPRRAGRKREATDALDEEDQ